jgi:hypothetical protein
MTRSRRWEESEIANGIREVRFLRWPYFVDYVHDHLPEKGSYIWRGQRCEAWKLESTLHRLLKNRTKYIRTSEFIKRHLERFKQQSLGKRGQNPPELSDLEWWTLARHHNLHTLLLDWSTSPFVAAYFAFSESHADQTPYRTIWAIDRPMLEDRAESVARHGYPTAHRCSKPPRRGPTLGGGLPPLLTSHTAPATPPVTIICPHSDENKRLISQGGLFTYCDEPLEDWIKKAFNGKDYSCAIRKFLIPDSERGRCLEQLDSMRINPATLFPDLDGAATYCNQITDEELGITQPPSRSAMRNTG